MAKLFFCGEYINVLVYMQIPRGVYKYRGVSHSTVYRDCHGWSSITAIHKEILVFTFSFNLNLSSKDIKVENMYACKKKMSHEV